MFEFCFMVITNNLKLTKFVDAMNQFLLILIKVLSGCCKSTLIGNLYIVDKKERSLKNFFILYLNGNEISLWRNQIQWWSNRNKNMKQKNPLLPGENCTRYLWNHSKKREEWNSEKRGKNSRNTLEKEHVWKMDKKTGQWSFCGKKWSETTFSIFPQNSRANLHENMNSLR